MAIGIRNLAAVLALALAAAVLALSAAPPDASASACQRWADKQPQQLTKGQARDAVLCLVNRERTSRGLKALDRSKKLQKAAQRHTEKMHGTGCFAHECPGEGDLTDRLAGVNYLTGGLTRWIYAENVAWGVEHRGTPEAIVEAWMGSSGHRYNILYGRFRDAGVGFESGTPSSKSTPGGIYTIDFGLAVR